MRPSGIRQKTKQVLRRGLAGIALPAAPLLARSATSSVRVFTYHRVNDDPADAKAVRTKEFDWQMRLLAEEGFRTRRIADLPHEPAGSHHPVVCITFDDGYLDNWRDAAPILARHGHPATFFVTTRHIGTDLTFPWDVRDGVNARMMSWSHIGDLSRSGHEIGAHTRTHPDLGSLPPENLEEEIVGAGEDIARHIKVWPKTFAYPFGRKRNVSLLARSIVARRYALCCTAVRGHNPLPLYAPLEIRRVSVQPGWTPEEFRAELLGVYDFVEHVRN